MRQAGITLIELLVAAAIASILLGYALFAPREWVQTKAIDATVRTFAAAVHLARQSAIVANAPVTLCPLGSDGCGARNTWHQGIHIFVDWDENRRMDERDYLIRVIASPTGDARVYWRSFRNRSYLRFSANGLTDWQNGNFLFCPASGLAGHARQLILNSAGRMYFSRDTNGDGVHEDASGRPVECS